MFHKLVFARPIGTHLIFASFKGGDIRLYDTDPLVDRWPAFAQLEDEDFFRSFTVDKGGYGISWSDELDLSADELHDGGKLFLSSIEARTHRLASDFVSIRRKAHLSQGQLEEACGVRQPVIARFESGASNPRLDTIMKALSPMGKTLAIVDIEMLEQEEKKAEPIAIAPRR